MAIFVHRVEGLQSGLYLLVRDPSQEKSLRRALKPEFDWRKPDGCPGDLQLYRLLAGDAAGPGNHGGRVLLARLCHALMRLMSESVDGDRVFHIDLRLRPGGKEGELTPSAAGAADYYLNQGRSWERQMLRANAIMAGTSTPTGQ